MLQTLMDRLIARYLNQMEVKEEAKTITIEDLEDAKLELLQHITTLAIGRKKPQWRKSILDKMKQSQADNSSDSTAG